MTPAGFEDPTLRLTNTITGETFDVPAEPSGAAGHFVARFTFPSAGTWSYGIQLQQLAVETQPVTGTVLEATPSGIPLIAVVTLAVLGVALAGFAIVWLSRRREPVSRRWQDGDHLGAKVREDRPGCELLVEETGKPRGAIRLGNGVDPAAQQGLAFAVDEDDRPPGRMDDELETLLGGGTRVAAGPDEVVEGLLARSAIGVEHQRRVHA